MTGYVYSLICPTKDEPVYVGSTKSLLEFRLNAHINSIKTGKQKIHKYFKETNGVPKIKLLQKVNVKTGGLELRRAEKRWRQKLTGEGFVLFNVNSPCDPNGTSRASITVTREMFQKIQVIAKREKRTPSQQAEYLLKKQLETVNS